MDEQSDTTHDDAIIDAADAPDAIDTTDSIEMVDEQPMTGELPPPIIEDDSLYAVDDEPAAPSTRRFTKPLFVGVAAGIVGLGIGAGAAALIGGHDEGRDRGDRGSMSESRSDRDQDGPFAQNGQDGQDGQMGQMGGRDGQMHGQQGMQGQNQQGQFQPPNGGGPMHGGSGGS